MGQRGGGRWCRRFKECLLFVVIFFRNDNWRVSACIVGDGVKDTAAEAAAVGVSPNSAIEKAKHKKEEQDTAEKTANTRTQKETKNAKKPHFKK